MLVVRLTPWFRVVPLFTSGKLPSKVIDEPILGSICSMLSKHLKPHARASCTLPDSGPSETVCNLIQAACVYEKVITRFGCQRELE